LAVEKARGGVTKAAGGLSGSKPGRRNAQRGRRKKREGSTRGVSPGGVLEKGEGILKGVAGHRGGLVP